MRNRVIIFLLVIILFRGCASITTPNGGPKDKRPPRLISSSPDSSQTNFKGKSVDLTFNELVKLNNPKEEVLISPSPGKDVEFKVKGTKVTITPKKAWKDSTTYSLLFRDGIQDITESNTPVGLRLAFSTGPTIDSMRVTGKVEELLKGTREQKITVAIYQSDTFDIFRDTANYFTKTDKRGNFRLENIKAGRYRIYAFDDKNKNLRVESRTERFGFSSDTLNLTKNYDSTSIQLIMLDSRPLKISSIRNAGPMTRIRFNKYITHYKLDLSDSLVNNFGDNQTEVNIWCPLEVGDSLKLHLTASDSLESTIDSIFYIKKTNAKQPKEAFRWTIGAPSVDGETGKFSTIVSYNKPVTYINFDSIFIRIDTANIIPITKADINIDPVKKTITIRKELDKQLFKPKPKVATPPKPKTPAPKDTLTQSKPKSDSIATEDKKPKLSKQQPSQPERLRLILEGRPSFLISIDNDSNKVITTDVKILTPDLTGILHVQADTKIKNYLIQLMDIKGNVHTTLVNTPKHTFKLLDPGEYQLRIVLDHNANGKWDPGNYAKNLEPERVIFYKGTDRKKTFPIRANWELGPLIIKF